MIEQFKEQFKEQIKSSEIEIKENGLKDLPIEAIEKVSGGWGGTAWIAWTRVY